MTRENLPHPADVESCLQITGHVDVSLRDRIAAVLYGNLRSQQRIDRPDRFLDWIDTAELADAVIEALPEMHPDQIRAKYLKDWEEGYDEGYSAGGGGC